MQNFNEFREKSELIYERDNSTPLFAVVAEKKFIEGKIEEAKKILDEGLSLYPDYAAAYYLYAKILISEGENAEAEKKLARAREIFSSEVLENYFEKLLSGEKTLLGNADPILRELNEEILPEKEDEEIETDEFVSETLATVYENQGTFDEAIEIYEKLIEKEPNNAEKYKAKIEELKSKK